MELLRGYRWPGNVRELRNVVERRVMADAPLTLRQVGDHFGISRERARQLELRACDKLRLRLGAAAGPGRGEPPGCAA
jgi:DNA-directed RNA polymerase sigma subunit (sigma70/sigma32)